SRRDGQGGCKRQCSRDAFRNFLRRGDLVRSEVTFETAKGLELTISEFFPQRCAAPPKDRNLRHDTRHEAIIDLGKNFLLGGHTDPEDLDIPRNYRRRPNVSPIIL